MSDLRNLEFEETKNGAEIVLEAREELSDTEIHKRIENLIGEDESPFSYTHEGKDFEVYFQEFKFYRVESETIDNNVDDRHDIPTFEIYKHYIELSKPVVYNIDDDVYVASGIKEVEEHTGIKWDKILKVMEKHTFVDDEGFITIK